MTKGTFEYPWLVEWMMCSPPRIPIHLTATPNSNYPEGYFKCKTPSIDRTCILKKKTKLQWEQIGNMHLYIYRGFRHIVMPFSIFAITHLRIPCLKFVPFWRKLGFSDKILPHFFCKRPKYPSLLLCILLSPTTSVLSYTYSFRTMGFVVGVGFVAAAASYAAVGFGGLEGL